jgi:hypothetical protein
MSRYGFMCSLFIALVGSTVCQAAERGQGRYSGVVVFDRWGGCTLASGVYVTAISEAVKEKLKSQTGKCVDLDVIDVVPPRNGSEGLIKELKVLGATPARNQFDAPDGLQIAVRSNFAEGKPAAFVIRVKNNSSKEINVSLESLAPTLLGHRDAAKHNAGPADGPSKVLFTREAFWNGDGPRQTGGRGVDFGWTATRPADIWQQKAIEPHGYFELRLAFKLPEGEYDFWIGYGGGTHEGRSIISQPIGFDVDADGGAELIDVSGR